MKPYTAACFLLLGCYALAQPTEPILRLNTPMHTAMIRRISTDAQNRYILTVSNDKTAKLWNAQTGALLQTFRPPIAPGNEGMLYAGAISPDGKTIAVAGWTGDEWDNSYSIYLFSTATATLLHRIPELPNVICDLEFSPDGKYLAAALGTGGGIRIYSVGAGWRLLKAFTDYGAESYNIAWDNTGRLATVCYDGTLRLYDNQFNLIRTNVDLAGNQPYSLAFSPDGALLAVGYDDSPRLQVLDGRNLKPLYLPDITDANSLDQRLVQVSFSQDGRYLLAGGFYRKYANGNWWRVIRRWKNQGRGSYVDFPATKNSIIDIKPLTNGDFLVAGTLPDFARMTMSGNSLFYQAGEINDYSATDQSHLKINSQGNVVAVKPLGKSGVVFDVALRKVAEGDAPPSLSSYTDQAQGITITDWNDSRTPQINYRSTNFLKTNEPCRATDIATYQPKIVFGADWYLYCTDKSGSVLWKTPTQATVWAVNISGNDKVVLAALGDGTLRWYAMADGKLLLTLYLHPDGRRWVLYTPEGYYDAAAGAEDFIGWHINQGKEREALFYAASRFRSTYYRPDVIDKVLETYDTQEAIRLANVESGRKQQAVQQFNYPPVVHIFSPTEGESVSTNTLTISYTAFSPGNEPITNVRVLIDGRPADDVRGFKVINDPSRQTLTISIPPRDVRLSVLAENMHGWSTPASVAIRWKGTTTAEVLKPNLYILAAGVSKYQNPQYNLQYPAKDAEDVVRAFVNQKGGLYGNVEYKLLKDSEANKNNLLDGLEWLQRQTTSRDVAVLFIAGHGMNDAQNSFYFMPYEADINSLRRTCLMFTELKYTVQSIAGKVLVFVDACHSGNVMGVASRYPDLNQLTNELSQAESGAVVYTSSTGRQLSLENPAWGNGAFTKAVVEGINGKADLFGNGTITIKTLDAYIAQRVKELTQGMQAPTAIIPESIPDFPIAIKK